MSEKFIRGKFIRGLRPYGLSYKDVKKWKYCGGNKGRHLTKFRISCRGEDLPSVSEECVCGKKITENLYITDAKDENILVLGPCCIKLYDVPKWRRHCTKCGKWQTSVTGNLCKPCNSKLVKNQKDKIAKEMVPASQNMISTPTPTISRLSQKLETNKMETEKDKIAKEMVPASQNMISTPTPTISKLSQKLEECSLESLKILAKNKKITTSILITATCEELLKRLRGVVEDADFPIIDDDRKIYVSAHAIGNWSDSAKQREKLGMIFDKRSNVRLWYTLKDNKNNKEIFKFFPKISNLSS